MDPRKDRLPGVYHYPRNITFYAFSSTQNQPLRPKPNLIPRQKLPDITLNLPKHFSIIQTELKQSSNNYVEAHF